MDNRYYEAPSDEIFNEIKERVIEIWNSYDNTFGYATEKINRVRDLENVQDNAIYMIAMFDHVNQGKLASLLSTEAREAIRDRMIAGGIPEELIYF